MNLLDLLSTAAAAVPRLSNPANYNLFASLDTSREEGATIEPGLDADFVASSPSVGTITAPWEQDAANLQPFRDRTTGAAYFREGRRLVSSDDPEEWVWTHDATSSGRIALMVRIEDLSSGVDLLATFNWVSSVAPGFALTVLATGAIRVAVGNGSTVQSRTSASGVLAEGTAHAIVVDKSGATFSVYVDGTLAVTGSAISSPSSDAPSHVMTVGAASSGARPLIGWIRQALFFHGAGLVPSNAWLLAYLQSGADLSGLVAPAPLDLLWDVSRSDTEYEAGSARRIQTVQNPGAFGGTRTQSTASNRPWAVRFPSGLVDYFPGGSLSVVSSLDASVFAGLHDDAAEKTVIFRFRINDLSSNQRILRTMSASNANAGIILQVQTDGRVRVFVGNGSGTAYAIDAFSGPGHVQEGVDYTIAFVKTPSSMALYLEGMATPLLSGALNSPSAAAPSETLTMGQPGNRIHGWVSEVVILGIAADQTQREAVATRLARHNFGASVTELISAYADDGLAHAYTPDSLQVTGGNVTAWNDVVGDQSLAVGDGTLVSLDGLDAIELGAFSGLSNNAGVAAIASGTDKSFAVVDYGQWVTGGYTLWQFGGNGAHWWGISGSNHRVGREDDGALNFDESNAIGATTAQRFFAHSFHSADGPNLMQVDGTLEAPSLDINPVTATEFGASSAGPGATIRLAYRLLFNRALNVGELTQLREALLREAA